MMQAEQIKYCKICTNRKFDLQNGVLCGLTNAKPDFGDKCEQFAVDEKEAQKQIAKEKAREIVARNDGFFAPEKKGIRGGVVGGLIMIIIAVIWFVAGLAGGIIFYYPPILAIIGIVAIVKGAAQGNLAGEKYKS